MSDEAENSSPDSEPEEIVPDRDVDELLGDMIEKAEDKNLPNKSQDIKKGK